MPHYISPLDETYIRFDAAAKLLAEHDRMVTSDGMLEMLMRAMWEGSFNLPNHEDIPEQKQSDRENPENWLCVPIEAPRANLTASQAALSPRPFEYFEAGRDTIISVMYTMEFLPGELQGWSDMLDHGDGKMYLHDKASAFKALTCLPLSEYSEAGKAYLGKLYIPRRMLQSWLDKRSLKFVHLFDLESEPETSAQQADGSLPDDDALPPRGRPSFPAWPAIQAAAIKLREEDASLKNKIIAHEVRRRALTCYNKEDVPSEATILRQLHMFIKPAINDHPGPD